MTDHPRLRQLPFAISEVTTFDQTFEEDAALYARAGCAGMGIWGFKMEKIGPAAAADILEREGLRAANCIPIGNSILPYVLSPEPVDPMERVEAFLPHMERMARLGPESIVVVTGPPGDRPVEEAREICRRGLTRIADVAADLGVVVALEPIHRSVRDQFTLIWDLPGTLEMLREVDRPSLKVLFDTWHLWDTLDVLDHVAAHIDLIGGVHIADWRDPTRGWADRAFPGEGRLPMADLILGLDRAGFRGLYDVEIFSDPGALGDTFENSLWRRSPEEIVARATAIFR